MTALRDPHARRFVIDKAIKPDDIPVGAELTVDVMKDPDLHPIAVSVMVEPPGPKPPADQK